MSVSSGRAQRVKPWGWGKPRLRGSRGSGRRHCDSQRDAGHFAGTCFGTCFSTCFISLHIGGLQEGQWIVDIVDGIGQSFADFAAHEVERLLPLAMRKKENGFGIQHLGLQIACCSLVSLCNVAAWSQLVRTCWNAFGLFVQYNELALVLWQRSPNCLYSGHTLWNLGFEPTELAPEWLLETDQFRNV